MHRQLIKNVLKLRQQCLLAVMNFKVNRVILKIMHWKRIRWQSTTRKSQTMIVIIKPFSRAAPSPQLSNINISKSAWILLAYDETRNCRNEAAFVQLDGGSFRFVSIIVKSLLNQETFRFCDSLWNGISGECFSENNDAKYFTILWSFMTIDWRKMTCFHG
jgi:hypothetical protein